MLYYLNHPGALLGIAVALYVGLVLHDAAQVLAAQALGDPLPRRSGRLTVQPQPHVTVFSVVTMVIVGTGWAEPIPMNDHWRRLRYRVSAAIVAGPLAYLVLCFLSVLALRLADSTVPAIFGDHLDQMQAVFGFVPAFLAGLAWAFGALFVTSLIPVPPTDGGRLLFTLGGTSPGWGNARYQLQERNFGLVIVMVLLILPKLFPGFPSVIDQIVPALVRGFGHAVGML